MMKLKLLKENKKERKDGVVRWNGEMERDG